MTKNVTILPCPFCGGMPSAYINLFERPHLLKCENAGCGVQPYVNAHSPGEAIRAWNQRGASEPDGGTKGL